MLFIAALSLLALPAVLAQSTEMTQAVSKLSYPASRGSNPLVSSIGPCQGYELGGRIDYPLTGGRVSWTNIRDLKNVQLAYSINANPSSQSDFKGVGQNLTISYVGSQCVEGPDFAALGLQAGEKVTLQLSWQAGPRSASGFECADLNLVSAADFAAANWTVTCENKIATTQMRSSANPQLTKLQAEQASSNTSASSAGSGLTLSQAGVTGALVSLAVVLLALAGAYFAGFAVFGKSAKRAKKVQRERAMNDQLTEKSLGSV